MNKKTGATPEQDAFLMPGEFDSHEKCWMLWPERKDNWRNNGEPAQTCFANVAHAISEFEPVFMGVSSQQLENAKKNCLLIFISLKWNQTTPG